MPDGSDQSSENDLSMHWNPMTMSALISRSGNVNQKWTLPPQPEGTIPIVGGIPDPGSVPIEDLENAFERVFSTTPDEGLRYGPVEGYIGLREAIAKRQSIIDQSPLSSDNILVSNGSAAAIDNVCTALIDPGDVIIAEGPTWHGFLRTANGHLADLVQVPVDNSGILVDKVEAAIKAAKASKRKVKFIYIISDFQNPSGKTMSIKRRRDLLEICAKYHVLILEDAAYSELHFDSETSSSIYSLADGNGVLKIGSFSKIIATGLRIGWVQGKAELISALTNTRFDAGNSILLQQALVEYLNSGKLESHIKDMRLLYKEKCEALCSSLKLHCAPYVKFDQPSGGYFLWLQCIGPNSHEVSIEAEKLDLMLPLGSSFFQNCDDDDTDHLRIAYSTATIEELTRVGPLLGDAFKAALGES